MYSRTNYNQQGHNQQDIHTGKAWQLHTPSAKIIIFRCCWPTQYSWKYLSQLSHCIHLRIDPLCAAILQCKASHFPSSSGSLELMLASLVAGVGSTSVRWLLELCWISKDTDSTFLLCFSCLVFHWVDSVSAALSDFVPTPPGLCLMILFQVNTAPSDSDSTHPGLCPLVLCQVSAAHSGSDSTHPSLCDLVLF